MEDTRRENERDLSHTADVEQKMSLSPPADGKEFPFPPFPPANSSTLNDAFSGHRTGEHKRRSRSHSRSASSLLVVAAERLGQETNRANALDLRCAEVLAHLRTIVEDRDQLRRSLAKVTEELSLYKLQLDVAQNEIFRAQKIVEGVDKARVDAEEQAAKDRTIARQLVSERAVWVAREEGRNEGFQEGLRQGRRWAFEAARQPAEEYTDDGDEEADEEPYEPPARRSPPSNRRGWSSVRSILPDAASYISTQPVHTVTPPPSSDAPSLESRQPAPQPRPPATPRPPPAQYEERSPSSIRPSRPLPRAPARSPEPIEVRPDRSNSRARTPSVSQPPVALPPDGFIPTVGPDSVITLPPPHELSRPVSTLVDEDTLRTPGTAHTPSGGRGRTMSNVSRGSTRLSEYDILSPPRRSETPITRSDQVAHAWRAANTTAAPSGRRQAPPQDASSENFSTRSSIPRSQVDRRSGPRRPREIVMPMPLSTSMHAAGMSHTRPATSHSYAQPQQQQAYTAAGPSHASPPTAPYAQPATSASYFPGPQGYSDDPTLTRPRSALAWLKTRFNRSVSASSVFIHVEPPSNSESNPSTDNTLNAVLLTPDDAGHRTLPQHFVPELADALAGVQAAQQADAAGDPSGNVIVLPDDELPRGFVPLSPISPIMPDLHNITPFPLDASTSASKSASASVPAPAPALSPQPPAYSPREIYAPPPRPSTAAGMTRARSPASEAGRARGASIGSAMLQTSPAPLNRPLSIFSET
ncbi:hypothetical protein FB451DRAFT_1513783 [Mycena latifolia]|nr:hypothetical protein FB451DRAFT_1513783 [Mycena latifolia]